MRARGYWWVACAIALGACLVRWPAFQAGLHSDDYVQAAMLAGRFAAPRSALALYDFGGRDPMEAEQLREVGWLPWWSASELRLAMFRPLSSATLALDHALMRDRPALWHLHSAWWLIAWLLGTAALLRQLVAPKVALLALLVLAADPCSSVPLAWLANRNALVSCALGVWGIAAYVRAARATERRAEVALLATAAVALALATLAGEYAIALLPAIGVYAWLDAGASNRRSSRLARALCVLAPALCVIAVSALLGYGARSSGAYISPLAEPVRYALALLERAPVLAAELFAAWPTAPVAWLGPIEGAPLRGAVALVVLWGSWLAARDHAKLPDGVRVLLISTLLGLPLLAGALPESRLLLPVAVGGAVLVASALSGLWRRLTTTSGAPRLLVALWAVVLVATQLGSDPMRAFASAALLCERSRAHTAWAMRADIRAEHAGLEHVVIAARDFTTAEILPYARLYFGLPVPPSYRVLSIAQHPHELTRVDARTLELRVLGPATEAFAGSLHRSSALPFHAGDRLRSGPLQVEVLETNAGQPVRMRFVFPRALEATRYRFMHPLPEGLRAIELPAVGEKLALPAPRAMRLSR